MSDRAIAARAATGLSLAAAPVFALLALATGGPSDMLCLPAAPFDGMSAMYGLMSAFHLAPWLRLISRQRSNP